MTCIIISVRFQMFSLCSHLTSPPQDPSHQVNCVPVWVKSKRSYLISHIAILSLAIPVLKGCHKSVLLQPQLQLIEGDKTFIPTDPALTWIKRRNKSLLSNEAEIGHTICLDINLHSHKNVLWYHMIK